MDHVTHEHYQHHQHHQHLDRVHDDARSVQYVKARLRREIARIARVVSSGAA